MSEKREVDQNVESEISRRLLNLPDKDALKLDIDNSSSEYTKVVRGSFSGTRVPVAAATGGIAGGESPYGDVTPGVVITKDGAKGKVVFAGSIGTVTGAIKTLTPKAVPQPEEDENLLLEPEIKHKPEVKKTFSAQSSDIAVIIKTKVGNFKGKVLLAENTIEGFLVLVYNIGDNVFIPPTSEDPISVGISNTGEMYTVIFDGVSFELNATGLGFIVFRKQED